MRPASEEGRLLPTNQDHRACGSAAANEGNCDEEDGLTCIHTRNGPGRPVQRRRREDRGRVRALWPLGHEAGAACVGGQADPLAHQLRGLTRHG